MRAAIRKAWARLLHRKLVVLAVLGGCAMGFLTVGSLGRQQDREPERFRVTAVHADTWKHDGKPRLIVRSPVQSDAYVRGMPETLFLDVRLDDDFREAWEIWRIDLVEIRPGGTKRLIESIQCVDNPAPESRFHAREYVRGLRRKDCTYAVVVFLHSWGASDQATDLAKRAIMDGRGITIKDVLQPWSQPTPSLCSRMHSYWLQ